MTEKNRQATLIICVFGLLAMAAAAYYYFMMAKENITRMDAEAKKIAEENIKSEREITQLKALVNDKARWEALKAKVEHAKRRLPQNPDDTAFFEILQETVRRTNISASRLQVKPVVPRPTYLEVPYEIGGAARYHDFGQFLNVVECHPDRLMRVSKFSLRNNDKRPSVHPMNITITTFTFNQ